MSIPETLYLIDGPNWAHQANSVGDLTQILEGMISRFQRSAAPRHVVSVWDDTEASFRRDLWPEYKADREARPEKLEVVKKAAGIFEAKGITVVKGMLGVEADDLIATLAARAPGAWRVAMLSADKDLFQLLDSRTYLCRRSKGASEIFSVARFREMYRVEPKQWPAVMALAGAKNGVPGLPGIGLQGACTLIAKLGDLETLIKKARTIKRKTYREALQVGADEARLYLKLMTLRRDLPVDINFGNQGDRR